MEPRLDRGVFTLSLDFELVWGSRDLANDAAGRELAALVTMARRTRDEVFPQILRTLERLGIVATWATVGHLFLEGAASPLHPALPTPRHRWRRAPWWEGVPTGTEAEHPAFYARSLVEALRDAGQEVGSHSFSHPVFGDEGCARAVADADLARCVHEARRMGLTLRSFVFPRNVPGHLDLLAQHGFRSWRPPEPTWYRWGPVPGPLVRLLHLHDVARAACPPTVMPRRDEFGLWQIPASATLLPIDGVRRAIPMSRRVLRATRGIDEAVRTRRVSHLYTHPINLASDPPRMLAGLDAILEHAARRRDRGELRVLPMDGLADLAEHQA